MSHTYYGHGVLSTAPYLWKLDPYVISNWHNTSARRRHVSTILGQLEPTGLAKRLAKLASLGSSPADCSCLFDFTSH
jgi:hypothetical protein